MKNFLIKYLLLAIGLIIGVVVTDLAMHYLLPPKAFQYSHFMVGKIETETDSIHFCRYSLGRDINKKFKEDFVVIERCGLHNVKDNLMLVKGQFYAEPLKKGK